MSYRCNGLTITLFGESHGSYIGGTIEGLPAGCAIDFDVLKSIMAKRAPVARAEADAFEIISGVYNGKTTGSPLTCLIKNNNAKQGDYTLARPSHSDYAAFLRYGGNNDPRGGGHLSGRLTAPLTLLGGICRTVLQQRGVTVAAHIRSVGTVQDDRFDAVNVDQNTLKTLNYMQLPLLNTEIESTIKDIVHQFSQNGDTLGGVIECAAVGLKGGLGDPIFHGIDSEIAAMLFSVPSVKAVEFGDGIEMATGSASQYNDGFVDNTYAHNLSDYGEASVSVEQASSGIDRFTSNSCVRTSTNHNGGLLGGITVGMPLIVSAYFKPVPTVGFEQCYLRLPQCEIEKATRYTPSDTAVVLRAAPIIEACVSFVLLSRYTY